MLLLLFTQVSAHKPAADDSDKMDAKAMLDFARLGRGFLVWERFENESWQIWSKQIDGTGEERLVAPEKGHDHFCPKISPDGALLGYMSYPTGSHAYPSSKNRTGTLWMMNLRTGGRTVVVPEARSYGEDRAVMWRDATTFCYIDRNGETMEMSLEKKKAPRKVIKFRDDMFGYLPSPDLRYATGGAPEFAPVEPDGTLNHQKPIGGCQPYFTSDSLWGYWMDGAGGPISAMFLPTRVVHQIMQKDDPSLPTERNYIYFPMVSQCMRLLAFGASADVHNHFEGNYDIFLAPIHPVSLKLLGKPVRYTNAQGCDRYPDVFRRELELGTHFIESMGSVTFAPAGGSLLCDFDFGDGTTDKARAASHVFKKPGDYKVTAVFGKNRRQAHGYVHVDPPTPPEVMQTQREDDRTLLVKFDRKVDVSAAKVHAGSRGVIQPQLTMAGHAVRLKLPSGLPPDARLTLEEFRSGGSSAGMALPATVLPLQPSIWPASQDGLKFAWRDAFTREGAGQSAGGTLTARGVAYWDRSGAMKIRGGHFETADAGKRISDASAKSNEFTLEAVITAEPLEGNNGKTEILSLSERGAVPNLVLRQQGKLVSFDLVCSGANTGGRESIEEIFGLEPGGARHVVFTFANGELAAYADGKRRKMKKMNLGALFKWKSQTLRFGAAADGSKPWRGQIERVAFYDRALTQAEVKAHADSWDDAEGLRSQPHEWVVVGRLAENTPVPSLTDIQPYKEALVRRLFEVEKNLSGDGTLPKQIAVTQWAWLGGVAMPTQSLKVGDQLRLTLHESESHPELKQLVVKDDLIEGLAARQFHDAGEWDEPVRKE